MPSKNKYSNQHYSWKYLTPSCSGGVFIGEPIKLSFVSFVTQLASHLVVPSDLAGVKVAQFYKKKSIPSAKLALK